MTIPPPATAEDKEFARYLRFILKKYTFGPNDVNKPPANIERGKIRNQGDFYDDFREYSLSVPGSIAVYKPEQYLPMTEKIFKGTTGLPRESDFLDRKSLFPYLKNWVCVTEEELNELEKLFNIAYISRKAIDERSEPKPTWIQYAKTSFLGSRVEVAEALIAMVEEYVKRNLKFDGEPPRLHASARTIHGLFNTRLGHLDNAPEWDNRLLRWREVLTTFVRKGGIITYTFRCDEDGVRGTPFALMKHLFEGGKNFRILFHESDSPKIDPSTAPAPSLVEYALIEDFAGVLAMATSNNLENPRGSDFVDSGLILTTKKPEQLVFLSKIAQRFEENATVLWENKIIETGAHPLLVASQNGLEFERHREGVNLFKPSSLPDKTRPMAWLIPSSPYGKALREKHNLSLSELRSYFNIEIQRQKIFEDRVQNHMYRDIIPMYLLEALVKPGIAEAYKLSVPSG